MEKVVLLISFIFGLHTYYFRQNSPVKVEDQLAMEVIGEASSGEEFLAMPNIHHADIILMDIVMDKMDGIETTKNILCQISHLKIIAITMHIEQILHAELIMAGFKGCIYKSDIFENLETAIEDVFEGKLFFPKKLKI